MPMLEAGEEVAGWLIDALVDHDHAREVYRAVNAKSGAPGAFELARPHASAEQHEAMKARHGRGTLLEGVEQIIAFGEHEELPFLVRRPFEGTRLDRVLTGLANRGERMRPELASAIALEIGCALLALHATDDVHGALDSAHVLVGTDSVELVGLALEGTSDDDARALAELLWELLTQRRVVYEGDVMAPVQRFEADIPDALAALVADALGPGRLPFASLMVSLDEEKNVRLADELPRLLERALREPAEDEDVGDPLTRRSTAVDFAGPVSTAGRPSKEPLPPSDRRETREASPIALRAGLVLVGAAALLACLGYALGRLALGH